MSPTGVLERLTWPGGKCSLPATRFLIDSRRDDLRVGLREPLADLERSQDVAWGGCPLCSTRTSAVASYNFVCIEVRTYATTPTRTVIPTMNSLWRHSAA